MGLGASKAFFDTVGEADIKPSINNGQSVPFYLVRTLCVSAAISIPIGILRFVVKYFVADRRLWGVLQVVVYIALTASLLTQAYQGEYDLSCLPATHEMQQQILGITQGTFNWSNEKFATTYMDIGDAGDFYNWMRGPIATMVTSQSQNAASVSATNNIPTLYWNPTTKAGIWYVLNVMVKQVRVKLEPQTILFDAGSGNSINFDQKVPVFTEDKQDTTTRANEVFHSNSYTTWYGKENVEAWDFPGASGSFVVYPGKSGQSTGGYPAGSNSGMWVPSIDASANAYSADIDAMQNSRWIDMQTSLVTVNVNVLNPNTDVVVSSHPSTLTQSHLISPAN